MQKDHTQRHTGTQETSIKAYKTKGYLRNQPGLLHTLNEIGGALVRIHRWSSHANEPRPLAPRRRTTRWNYTGGISTGLRPPAIYGWFGHNQGSATTTAGAAHHVGLWKISRICSKKPIYSREERKDQNFLGDKLGRFLWANGGEILTNVRQFFPCQEEKDLTVSGRKRCYPED